MAESPFTPRGVAFFGARIALEAGLVAVAADGVGVRALPTVVAAGLTLVSAAAVVAVAVGAGGIRASYADVCAAVLLFPVVGYAVLAGPSAVRVAALVVLGVPAAALVLYSVPVYGEAFVAP